MISDNYYYNYVIPSKVWISSRGVELFLGQKLHVLSRTTLPSSALNLNGWPITTWGRAGQDAAVVKKWQPNKAWFFIISVFTF